MIGGVTRHSLPHLPGVLHLHVNRPLVKLGGKMQMQYIPGLLHYIVRRMCLFSCFFTAFTSACLLKVCVISCSIAMSSLQDNPCPALLLLRRLLRLEPSSLISYMDVLVQALPSLLEPGIPRRVQTLCCELWTKMNTVIPRK